MFSKLQSALGVGYPCGQTSDCTVTISPLDLSELEKDWLSLSAVSYSNFFLSWSWISAWIKTYQPDLHVVKAFCGSDLVGLALLVLRSQTRYKLFPYTTAYFQETGLSEKDQIWIEYNGFLVKNGFDDLVYASITNFLSQNYPQVDEIEIGALSKKNADCLLQTGYGSAHELWLAPSYGIDLQSLRQANKSFLATLSKNTRHQITRSIRLYEKRGDIKFTCATSTEQALEYFSEIEPFHLKRWGDKQNQSGFSNPWFTKFHRLLISTAWPKGEIDVIKITINEEAIAYLYNFTYNGHIYFYLMGLVQEQDNKLKPGLVAHTLAVEHYLRSGQSFYDFMGGDERYKKSLAIQVDTFYRLRVTKPSCKYALESYLRKLKNRLTNGWLVTR